MIIWAGIPNLDMTCWKKRCAVASSLMEVEQGMNITNFVSLSTITRILLWPDNSGSSGMKSIETTSNGHVKMGIG